MEYSSSKLVRLLSQSRLCTGSVPMHLNRQVERNLDGSNASPRWRGWVKRTKKGWRKSPRSCLGQHFIATASPLRRYASIQVLICGFARKGKGLVILPKIDNIDSGWAYGETGCDWSYESRSRAAALKGSSSPKVVQMFANISVLFQ